MKLKDFKNKRITVMGLGVVGGGIGVVRFLTKAKAKVLVTDLREELKDSLAKIKKLPLELVLGRHRAKDFTETDMIIKNPGVPDDSPYLKIAKQNKVQIETDIGIFFKLCKAETIGVTGTKGKSTVATLLFQLLKTKYANTILCGNIGVSPLEHLDKIRKSTKVVLELSSWQLDGLKKHEKSPNAALITNIYPDHLNRYESFNSYVDSKKIIFLFQKKKDSLFLNYDDEAVRSFSKLTKSKVHFFSKSEMPDNVSKAAFISSGRVVFKNEPVTNLKNLKLKADHNLSNILAAVSLAKFSKVPSKNIEKVLKKFSGIEGRQELIAEIQGVKYVNDTTSTMPLSSTVALKSFSSQFPKAKIILIAGGQDKGLEYKSFAKEAGKLASSIILLPGSATSKMKKEFGRL
ncbi:UDP-N-acetylmuramoyl-L-alanine--D-glutamate ligase, partial [Patescibacteria group bacterium]